MENLTRFLPLNSLLHTVKVVKWGGSNPMEFLKFFSKFFPLRQMGYRKRSRIPPVNVRRAAKYLKPKGVETAYIFGSGLKIANSAHDLGVVVDLLLTARNKRK
jgi:hypothetical protein